MEVLVVGGGISGMATAFEIERAAEERGREVDVRVLEATSRLGGKVDTRRRDGFIVEGGVNGWLSSRVQVDDLVSRLGLDDARIVSSDAAKKRFLWRGTQLESVPLSPGSFFKTDLIGWRSKGRLLLEPFAGKSRDDDESIADFIRRRLGSEFLDSFVDPMVTGIYAGDTEQLSMRSSFPKMVALEDQYGGLIKGMFGKRREAKKSGAAASSPGGPAASKLISMQEGASQIIDGLRARLRNEPQTGAKVTRIEREGAGWAVTQADGSRTVAPAVVLATPSWVAAQILSPLDDALASELKQIPYVAVAVVALAWRNEDLPRPLDGFGFLVPSGAHRDVLGTLWDSSVFSGRAPDGHSLTRTMVGGARRGELLERDDDGLIGVVHTELKAALGAESAPAMAQVIRHPHAIPQYVIGHAGRIQRIDDRISQHAGLELTGNAYHGVSLADCVTNAKNTALRVLGESPAEPG